MPVLLGRSVYGCEVSAMRKLKTFLPPLFFAAGFFSCSGSMLAAEIPSPAGTWRGESKCTTDAPACHDEHVVYYVEAVPGRPDQLSIRADKIIDGKAITMGSGPWNYDAKKQTISFESNRGLWLLAVHGDHIDGTLTVDGNVVFRHMRLTLDSQ
jgi:hypothetical protein